MTNERKNRKCECGCPAGRDGLCDDCRDEDDSRTYDSFGRSYGH